MDSCATSWALPWSRLTSCSRCLTALLCAICITTWAGAMDRGPARIAMGPTMHSATQRPLRAQRLKRAEQLLQKRERRLRNSYGGLLGMCVTYAGTMAALVYGSTSTPGHELKVIAGIAAAILGAAVMGGSVERELDRNQKTDHQEQRLDAILARSHQFARKP